MTVSEVDCLSTQGIAKDNLYSYLSDVLLNKDIELHERFRALFTLKNIGGQRSIEIIGQGFDDESALLKHELAYVLGQMKDKAAIPILISVLDNVQEEPMVRHEAAEALGAIGDESSLCILEKYKNDPEKCVSETCEIAIDNIKFETLRNKGISSEGQSSFSSIDPAPSLATKSLEELECLYLDDSRPLFERYRAMFGLRNEGSERAVEILAKGFGDKSELFRHEVAYVFGQMQHPASVPALIKVLDDKNEVGMVRHECAEALGSIATKECYDVLKAYSNDSNRVVRESCLVALDMYEHENSGEFQYANGVNNFNDN
ncbi:ARM repeat-containing protein [Rozella allomycis CSF55]|uniref:Deoxyhypusine hydroxylase n=1 Tax=Rozella allomycis (strain CSF55) TaxID=988480 RepID=A0A075APG2_ROZAC|nr:Deoxyhypusine hydroxylase-like PROTEIN [Rozella allomycis CSF55]RKP22021.1 ARM repeat-containing protein [Rozella allomycis CSF55]|eukprot:EPZ31976.1 Deoxyhypusine hydroxylase-like PROTEIN [Rozella allomycis CSF55]